MGNLLCVEGLTLGYVVDPQIISVEITVNNLLSDISTVVASQSAYGYHRVNFSILALSTTTGFVQDPVGASGSIKGNSLKVKSIGKSFVLDNAQSEVIVVSGVIGSSPATYPIVVNIQNAGQSVVRML